MELDLDLGDCQRSCRIYFLFHLSTPWMLDAEDFTIFNDILYHCKPRTPHLSMCKVGFASWSCGKCQRIHQGLVGEAGNTDLFYELIQQFNCLFCFFHIPAGMIGIYWNALWETTVSDPVLLFPGRSGSFGQFHDLRIGGICQGLGLPAIVQGMFESRRPGEPRALTHKGHITTRHHSASRARGSPVANSWRRSHRPNAFNPASECCDARVLDGFGQVTIDVYLMLWFQMVSDFSDEDGSCIVWG